MDRQVAREGRGVHRSRRSRNRGSRKVDIAGARDGNRLEARTDDGASRQVGVRRDCQGGFSCCQGNNADSGFVSRGRNALGQKAGAGDRQRTLRPAIVGNRSGGGTGRVGGRDRARLARARRKSNQLVVDKAVEANGLGV